MRARARRPAQKEFLFGQPSPFPRRCARSAFVIKSNAPPFWDNVGEGDHLAGGAGRPVYAPGTLDGANHRHTSAAR